MIKLYDESATRTVEKEFIKKSRITSLSLMRRASESAFARFREIWPSAKRVSIFCGGGNNGGDGYHLALIAARAGLDVEIFACGA